MIYKSMFFSAYVVNTWSSCLFQLLILAVNAIKLMHLKHD